MSVGYVAVYQTSGGSPSPSPTPTGTPTPTPTPTPSPTPTGRQCTTTATADISADCYSGSQGSISVTAAIGDTNPSGVDGNQAAQLASGDYLEYPGINFGSGSSQFDARVTSGAAGGVSGLVEVVLDNPSNAPVGSFAVGTPAAGPPGAPCRRTSRRSPEPIPCTWSSRRAPRVTRRM